MAQHDYGIDNSTGANVRADINNALLAISSNNSGSSAPSTTYALQSFANTTDSMLQLRNAANNAFVNLRKFDGTLPLPDGTNSAPSLFFDDDTNTGIFSGAADEFNIATGGTERFVINSSGNVGIGTDPSTNLHVKGSGTDILKIESTDTGTQGANLILQHSPGSGNMANNDVISLLQFNGVDNSNAATTYASIRAVATNVANNSETGDITFHTRNGSTFGERVRIDSSGKVHIGLTNGSGQFNVKNQNDSTQNAFEIYNDNGVRNAAFSQNSSGDATLDLRTNAPLQTVLIQSNGNSHFSGGNVGIGTSSPSFLLHCSGSSDPTIQLNATDSSPCIFSTDSNRTADGQHLGELRAHWNGTQVARIVFQAGDDTTNKDNGQIVFFTAAAGSTTESMRIDESQRLLIGGTTNVSTGGIEGSLQILGTGSDDASVNLARFSNNIHPSFLCFSKSRSGSIGGNTIVQNNDRLGVIAFFGSDGTDLACEAAEIECEVDGSPSGDNMPGKLIFKTTASGTSPSERMRISSNGNIGAPSGSNIFNASDSRVKTNIVNLEKGLSDIKSLRPVSFNWIDGFCDEEKNTLYGFIAQEVQTVDSNLIQDFSQEITVKDTKIENVLRVNEKFMIPMLVKAIQELSAKVETLESA